MKIYKYSLALMLGLGALTSCEDKLELTNPNQQTTSTFAKTTAELQECVIACYNHIRMEGSYARVGYTYDVVRGDEAWNSGQGWNFLNNDDLNFPATNEDGMWPWREWYYTINTCNFVVSRCTSDDETIKRIKGQALFLRGLSYYNLAIYYQNPPLINDYSQYSSLDGLYASNDPGEGKYQYDIIFDQIEKDFKEAMELLPSRDEKGEWAKGRATCGAAAGYYARALMQRHKYEEALKVLKDIMNSKEGGYQLYGNYSLMPNYGDNFREGEKFENNDESLFEVQYLDLGTQGTDEEWTPVNTSANATQGHAIESNFAPGSKGGWADIAASPWLYGLFKAERTTANSLDPRLYWTIGTYEPQWNTFEYGNVCYGEAMTPSAAVVVNNNFGGLPIAKHTNLRTGLYEKVTTGLKCGINVRLMRYSDVLLRAAECENELHGVTPDAIKWINAVRTRAKLPLLTVEQFKDDPDALFEQIANVERPKEFGCEYGRMADLIRWGFFYDADRLQQLQEHSVVRLNPDPSLVKEISTLADVANDSELKSTFKTFSAGNEFMPISIGTLNNNPHLVGNSANNNTDNAEYFAAKGWRVHPVVK